MRRIATIVEKHPKKIILITVLIFLLSVYTLQYQKTAIGEHEWLPESEVARAYIEIEDNYGPKVEYIQILVQSRNVLSNQSLDEILYVEQAISSDEHIRWMLLEAGSPSIFSIADTIGTSLAIAHLRNFNISAEINLTIMRAAITGGEVYVVGFKNGIPWSGYLTFYPASREAISSSLREILQSEERERVMSLLSKDFNETKLSAPATVLLVTFNASKTSEELLDNETRMQRIIDRLGLEHIDASVIGEDLVHEEITEASNRTTPILLFVAYVLVVIILFITLRSIIDTLLSVLVLFMAITVMNAAGVVAGIVFNPMTQAVPVLIVGLGIDYSIHTVLRYNEEKMKGRPTRRSIHMSITTVGVALGLATVTTSIAFASNLTTDMRPLRWFGFLAVVGIILSFLFTVTFLPAAKSLLDNIRGRSPRTSIFYRNFRMKIGRSNRGKVLNGGMGGDVVGIKSINRALKYFAIGAEHHTVPILIAVILVTSGSAYMTLQLKTEFDIKDFLPKDLEISRDLNYLMDNFNISTEISYILVKGDVASPSVLIAMNQTVNNMANDDYVDKEQGVPKVFNVVALMRYVAFSPEYAENFSEYYLKLDRDGDSFIDANILKEDVVQAYDALFQIVPDQALRVLHRVKSEDGWKYDGAVLRINVNSHNQRKAKELYDELRSDISPLKRLRGHTIDKVTITGGPVLSHVIIKAIERNGIQALILTVIASMLVLSLVFWFMEGRPSLGVITVVPVVLVISWTMASMYFLGIPLNVMTIMIASLTVGLGVDYAIHISHRYVEDLKGYGDSEKAIDSTVRNTGSAIFSAASTTIAAFGLLAFSILPPLQQFGIITAMTIFYSFVSSVIVLPVFLVLWTRHLGATRSPLNRARGSCNVGIAHEKSKIKMKSREHLPPAVKMSRKEEDI